VTLRPPDRSIVQPLAPERYRVQFTIGESDRVKLSRLQALLCREVPKGDPGSIYSLALDALLEKVEKAKLGKRMTRGTTRVPSGTVPSGTVTGGTVTSRMVASGTERPIRRATDDPSPSPRTPPSRHIPNPVKRAVWFRDAGQCTFVSEGGLRCTQRRFLELHHIHPYALNGPATAGNIALRCRRHNAYEAEVVFGARARREKSGT